MKHFKLLLQSSVPSAQFIRYTAVAGLGLAVDFTTVIITKQALGLHYLVAAGCGFALGLIVTYILSNKLVFGTPKAASKHLFILFSVIGLVGLLILSCLMWLLTGKLGLNYILSKSLATIVVFAWNFIARKSLYHDESAALPYEL